MIMNNWKTISADLLQDQTNDVQEKDFQKTIYTHFYYLLGWHNERVEQQYQLRVGSNIQYVYPDIVFFKNDEKVFVIEVKKPTHIQTREDINQLASYMKLLSVQFGLYVGEHVELFYKSFDEDILYSILKLDFLPELEDGRVFVEFFEHRNFSKENLLNYCISQIEKLKEKKKVEDCIEELASKAGEQILIDILIEKLSSQGYSKESIESIVEGITINVCRNSISGIENSNISQESIFKESLPQNGVSHKKRANDHTKYSFNGYGVYGKGRLALEIVKRFVKDNPNMSYKELQAKIPLPVMSYSEIQSWKFSTEDKSKDRRWFEDNSDLMKSFDGVVFAFTNQIGKDNIGEMIKFALRQGYKIDILNNVK